METKKQEYICKNCGKDFKYRNLETHQHKTVFCSNLCRYEWHNIKKLKEKKQ